MLTPSQIQESVDVNPLLDTTIDCLHFVTRFFEVICQSTSHIYHSALQLASPLSMVRKLYTQEIYSPLLKVVSGVVDSEDSCTASVKANYPYGVWSPYSRLIAVYAEYSTALVELRDPNTLEVVSTLCPPINGCRAKRGSVSLSPDGHLLACEYFG